MATPAPELSPPGDVREFDLGDHGLAAVTVRLDGIGGVVYEVVGPRMYGAVTVRASQALRTDTLTHAMFTYGIDTGQPPDSCWAWRRLTVNGIELFGRFEVAMDRLERLLSVEHGWAKVRRIDRESGRDEPAPPATRVRTLALLNAVMADFAARPDLPALHRAAAAVEAQLALADTRRAIAGLNRNIADARAAIHLAERREAMLLRIASGTDLPVSPRLMLTALSGPCES